MIIGPLIMFETPQPTAGECDTLLTHTRQLISRLESVLRCLEAASSSPDEALTVIKDKVNSMLSEAKALKTDLEAIKAEATRKISSNTGGSVTF